MVEQQQKLVLSPYMDIYELVIPKDNLLRQMKELVDFSFIYEELIDKYCLNNGRNAVPPERYELVRHADCKNSPDCIGKRRYKIKIHSCGCSPYKIKVQPENAKTGASGAVKETAACCL